MEDRGRTRILGVKCTKEVANAIRGTIMLAKLSIIPVWRGY
ncbi:rCG22783 [Rattus norvegicus]|uniref:RCG22783 n=1 Tax=Rattus norvegicus TaxID=10116 RepID=A6JYF2_RAT|nr:rCG22783 [Rattus norvegicus]